MQKINVLVDTQVVDDNTEDSLQIEVSNETPVELKEVDTPNGIVRGDNLTITTTEIHNLGDLKKTLDDIATQRTLLDQQEKDTQALIDSITPQVDAAVASILSQGGKDNRMVIKPSPITPTPVDPGQIEIMP